MTKPLSTERIRNMYTWATAWRTEDDLEDGESDLSSVRASLRAEFDAWLRAHDAQVKAEAWDEGYGTGVHDERTAAEVAWPEYREPGRVNPYRVSEG